MEPKIMQNTGHTNHQQELEELLEKENLTMTELAQLSGIRQSTIKYYTEAGILPHLTTEKRLWRRYEPRAALKRLEQIKKLKNNKRLTISEIIEQLKQSK